MNDFSAVGDTPAASGTEECVTVGDPLPKGLEPRSGLLLVRLGNLLSETADERLAGTGVDGRGYGILAILAEDGPGSQYALAQMLGKAPGVVVAAIDQLEQAGMVERNRDPADRRRSVVTLTAAGRTALARADEIADRAVAEILAGLDADELGRLRSLLTKGLAISFRD
jgi:DNA-binding MarR family transcriptional regulator